MKQPGNLADLSPVELSALKRAAAWYASYHAPIISDRADDRSAMAAGQRDEYRDLLSGLRKLGVQMRDPIAPEPEPIVIQRRAA